MSSTDTIYALATPPGKSGVAILRISGPKALVAMHSLAGLASPAPRHAHYVAFRTPATGETIDHGLALWFPHPHSFTGEDVVEFHIHGSLAVMRQMLEALSGMEGFRHADPGEFTRRAFLHNKMDLIEAEGLADLIEAETRQQAAQALRQMEGRLSGFYDTLREKIIGCMAHLEAYIDFPDEEIPESVLATLDDDIRSLCRGIATVLDDQHRGERLRDGIHVVILGAPNAGKSSLLNAIARRDAAIVSDIPGTTRDAIEIHTDIAGYPVVFTDTAGLRESHDAIEAEGIRRAMARAESADIRLVLFDGQRWPEQDETSRSMLDESALEIVSKCDLVKIREQGADRFFISTQTGEGLEALFQAIGQRIIHAFSGDSAPMITRDRHRALLSDTLKYLQKSLLPLPLEMRCEELRQATQAVGKITGKIQVDDVLEVIFKRFCIGK